MRIVIEPYLRRGEYWRDAWHYRSLSFSEV